MNRMKEIYTKFEFEFNISFLGLITFLLWTITNILWVVPLVIYSLIFGYLLYKEKPISDYIIVVFFTIIVKNNKPFLNYDYIFVVVLLLICLFKAYKRKAIVIGKLLPILLVNLIYAGISLSYGPNLQIGISGIGRLLEGYMGYLIITNSDVKWSKNLYVPISKFSSIFLFVITAQILYTYSQYNLQDINHIKDIVLLGWNFSNLIAPLYVLLIPISLYKFLDIHKFYWGYFFLDLLNILGLVLTLSRGGYVGLAVGLLIFTLINFRKWRSYLRYGLLLLLIILGVYIIPKIHELINLLVYNLTQRGILFDNNRYPLYEFGLKLFKERPIFGWGFNSSYTLLTQIHVTERYFHNFILQVAVSLGILGLILLGFVLVRSILILYRSKNAFIMAMGCGIIGSLVNESFDIMFDYLMFGLIFYTIIGLAERIRSQDDLDSFTNYEFRF